MEWDKTMFIILIIAISTFGWLANNWIRAKHGYSLEDEWGGKTEPRDTKEATELRKENAELRSLLGKVDKRMQVLERIVTDKGYTVAAEIEALRDAPDMPEIDSGVPLDIENKDRVS